MEVADPQPSSTKCLPMRRAYRPVRLKRWPAARWRFLQEGNAARESGNVLIASKESVEIRH